MGQKRKRPTIPRTTGLAPGETLKRNRFSGASWGWVSEVSDASNILPEHLLHTIGIYQSSAIIQCENKFAEPSEKPSALETAADKAHVNGELKEDYIEISDSEETLCDKKVCNSTPHCLNYLGQSRWEDYDGAKEAYLKLAKLGPNPLETVREPGSPVGLKNLGATCYANALLQVWFQNLPFRSGVYRCQPSGNRFEESPVFHLQATFAALEESTQNIFNPVRLVESLKLRTSEQQDAQEFSKLFMSHLDSEFKKQENLELQSLVADQFQGGQVYGTICENCKTKSERPSEFLEIEVSIDKNNAKLEDCVNASIAPESLTGDNKYFCSNCNSLQDATRYSAYTSFPPVLHFSLLRFVYDLRTMERKKSKHIITFPMQLDMSQFLRPQDSEGRPRFQYDLRGILLHKGTSAYHGHYEAQVFESTNAAWYQYNDELVTKIKSLGAKPPVIEVIDADSFEDVESKPLLKARQRKKRRIESDDETEKPVEEDTRVSSKDAYMLVYVRREVEESTSNLSVSPHHQGAPARALELVHSLNQLYDLKCEEYDKKQKDAIERFNSMRCQVMDIYQAWESSSHKSVVVSKLVLESILNRGLTWLPETHTHDPMENSFAPFTNLYELPPELEGSASASPRSDEYSNSDIQCDHGSLDPSKLATMKFINMETWEKLRKYGFIIKPMLTTEDVCRECVVQTYEEKKYLAEHPRLVSEFEAVCEGEPADFGFWISKAWLKDWRQVKPKMHSPGRADPAPDAPDYLNHVVCEHGSLSPSVISRRKITVEGCQILQRLFTSWDPLTTADEDCAICEAQIHESKEGKRSLRKQAEEERIQLKNLYETPINGRAPAVEGVSCCIIPTKFIRDWKQWLLKPTDFPRPLHVGSELGCWCGKGDYGIDPNSALDLNSNVTIILKSDWDILNGLKYMEANQDIKVLVERRTDADEKSYFWYDWKVCDDCRRRRLRNFETTELTIRLLGPGDPVPAAESYLDGYFPTDEEGEDSTQPAANNSGGLRQSKRLRLGKNRKKRIKIAVTKAMDVHYIQTKIEVMTSIPMYHQNLYYRGQQLDNKLASVEEIGIMLNDVLDLQQQAVDVDDFEDDVGPFKRLRRSPEREGFGGTLLGGFTTDSSEGNDYDLDSSMLPEGSSSSLGRPNICPNCRFENAPDEGWCEGCETTLNIDTP